MQGTIKIVKSKGFGFIETKEDIDFFFHHSEYQGDFKELVKMYVCQGDKKLSVTFDNDMTAPTGPRAVKVTFVGLI